MEQTTATYILRDHDADKLVEREQMLEKAAAFLNGKYGEGTVTIDLTHTYRNMKEKILPVFEVITIAEAAIRAIGAEPVTVPIRGGTDGATPELHGAALPEPGYRRRQRPRPL